MECNQRWHSNTSPEATTVCKYNCLAQFYQVLVVTGLYMSTKVPQHVSSQLLFPWRNKVFFS